ncbi:hypothetical protein [Photobacterium leiognathi]|uniref:hypothetical protein n=1 Tax=Photobacterium leiognathi TaxID=553611 RepID=UPI000D16B2CB|nr:hypothetical protein [Photobacterium leiognathi]PSW53058.1 hypothetical protein C0W50_19815 [Photobacterium leiognathi subsp. mandapamensis]
MNLNPKSRLVSLVLTVLLGPLGLFYSSVVGGLILCVIAFVSLATVIGPVICWILAIAIGDHCTYKHNKNIDNIKSLVANKG